MVKTPFYSLDSYIHSQFQNRMCFYR